MADKSELSDILLNGIDLKMRRIYFGVPIDYSSEDATDFSSASVEIAIRAIHKMAADHPAKPIEIHMNSFGGDVYSMLRLHDEILSCTCQVKFFGGGAIMSAATWIMAVCDERYLYPNATVMVHELSDSFTGKRTDIQINADEDKRLTHLLCELYAANSRMPKEFWMDVCQRDLYLTASEAIMLGLADKIVEPKRRGNLRKSRQSALKKIPDHKSMRSLINSVYSRLNRVKIPKLELNQVIKEPNDPHVIVDNTPIKESIAESSNGSMALTKDEPTPDSQKM